MVNSSLSEGKFPDVLKNAVVTPILKSGSPSVLNNYRPISVLPLLSKIFEKCIATRLVNYMQKYDMISSKQFGFQKRKNTTDAVVDFVESIYKSLNEKKHVLGITIDLMKAFDMVNHEILLRKLFMYGIRGIPLSLFKSYLGNRTQRVKI